MGKAKLNSLDDMLKIIQRRTGMSISEIAEKSGYTRQHLYNAKKFPEENLDKIKGKLYSTFKKELEEDNGVPLVFDDHALIVVLLSRISKLLAASSGRTELVELELMKQEAHALREVQL